MQLRAAASRGEWAARAGKRELLDGGQPKGGLPLVKGASVTAEVVGPEKGEKLVIQKLRRRKNMRRKTGCRHIYTRVRIATITA